MTHKLTVLAILLLGINAATMQAAEKVRIRGKVVYAEHEGEKLKLDLYLPQSKGPHPGVVLIHGGGWAAGTRLSMATVGLKLARRGYVAASISYRLAPAHKFPAQVHDCKAAVGWLRKNADELHLDRKRIAAWGYSAGGHLAAMLGTTSESDGLENPHDKEAPSSRVQAVIAGGAPCDFRTYPPSPEGLKFWLGASRTEKPEVYRAASPLLYVTKDDPPTFFYHGAKDRVVPPTTAQAMHRRLKKLGVRTAFLSLPRYGHFRALLFGRATPPAMEFLDSVLKP